MQGIYMITNPQGKIYIGLSTNIEKRWESYRHFTGISQNSSIKKSLKKYGFQNHKFEVLEEVVGDGKKLRERERYWINIKNSLNEGLNDNRGGCGTLSHTEESKRLIGEANSKPKPKDFGKNRKKFQHKEEYKEKLRKSPRCPVEMYDLDGNFIQEFPNQQMAADFIGVKKQSIWNVLNGYINKKSGNPITQVRGYTFKYKNK